MNREKLFRIRLCYRKKKKKRIMSILPVTVYGDKILTKKALPVEQITPEIIGFVQDMFDTMYNADGVGLAANQVGSDRSIFVIDLSPVEGFENTKPMTFINPKIVERSEETEPYEEGCLSLPFLRADVIRPIGIKIKYLDLKGEEQVFESDDFWARVIQHEYDHLQGKMIPDRVTDDLKKQLKKELIRIKNRDMDIPYPVTEKE